MKMLMDADAVAAFEESAEAASNLLTAMGNPKRLILLCNLLEGEKTVGHLAGIVGLAVSAASQHLGKMRALGLVRTRREGQQIYYHVASPAVEEVLATLYQIYCGPKQA
jgi:DNA-binding transcriptional ArsR family regulator